MVLVAQECPVELRVVVPFGPLAEFAPHEEQLLAGHRVLVAVKQPQVGELLPVVAGHLRDERPLSVHDFVVRQGQDEVLGEGINHAERQLVLMVLAVDGLVPQVAQRVVHPAHVPLHAEAEAADIDGCDTPPQAVDSSAIGEHAGEGSVQMHVEILEELDRLEVLAAAVVVGNPLARFARIVEVEHRGDGIDAQAVNVIRSSQNRALDIRKSRTSLRP